MVKEIAVELLTKGVKFSGPSTTTREGGAGPAEGMFLKIGKKLLFVPIKANFVKNSPYEIKRHNGEWTLYKDNKKISNIAILSPPYFYKYKTSKGLPYQKIFLAHGKDCLATTVVQTCAYWNSKKRCVFCGIELSLKHGITVLKKTPEDLAQVAKIAKEKDNVKHVVLTTGSLNPPGKEIDYLMLCARAIKKKSNLPIHVQFLPPEDLRVLYALKDAGVDTVGIHIEVFDEAVLKKVAPVKAEIGLKKFLSTWKEAVKVFGPNQVSSYLIVGLGESVDSVIWGSEILADLGVYPFVVPLRPIPGTFVENLTPPDPELLKKIYSVVGNILSKKGLSAKNSIAGCVKCSACSVLDMFELPPKRLICHSVRTDEELREVFYIRKRVFVEEEKIFRDDDRDEYDDISIHLVAKKDSKIVGTVRVYPLGGGEWRGSRLAVLKEHRDFRVGRILVKEAMKRVKKEGAKRFTAYILKKNVNFFKKLGWKPIGEEVNLFGKQHQLMEADLNRVSLEFVDET